MGRKHATKSAKSTKAINEAFGKALRMLRESKQWSQEEFARQCELDRTYISLIERGKQSPTLRNVQIFCRGLDISLVELFALVEKNLPHDKYHCTSAGTAKSGR